MSKPIIYISGKVSKMEAEAYILFERAEVMLRKKGYEVINPMKLEHNHDKEWESYMRIDLVELMKCDAVYFLNNWIYSKGARLEYINAYELGLALVFEANKTMIEDLTPKFKIDYKKLLQEDFIQPLITKKRTDEVVIPRQYIMNLLINHTMLNRTEIGNLFNRDRATVSHAKKVIENAIEVNDAKTLGYIDVMKKLLFTNGYIKNY